MERTGTFRLIILIPTIENEGTIIAVLFTIVHNKNKIP